MDTNTGMPVWLKWVIGIAIVLSIGLVGRFIQKYLEGEGK